MKRAHRRTHLWLWIVIAPALAAVLYLALSHRQVDPINDTLPSILTEETS